MTLFIKKMVSNRCKMVVARELTKLGLPFSRVELGVAEIEGDLSFSQYLAIEKALSKVGLALVDDRDRILIRKIEDLITELVYHAEEPLAINLSVYLSRKLNRDYACLTNAWSKGGKGTIEKFYITQKIDRVKELIASNTLTLTEIAFMMHYSSVAHLSAQFKKCTGITASHYKQLAEKKGPG